MSFDEFDWADNCNDEKRMLDAELEGEELKTLKEIFEKLPQDAVDYNVLRAEAVKWYKQSGQIETGFFIKHFFNLSEEDLK